MKLLLNIICKSLGSFFMLLVISFFSFCAFGKKQEVMDLGDIEIKGEVRRPNMNLIYSKKYISRAMILIAKEELKKFEKELLKPAVNLNLKAHPKRGKGM